MKEPYHTVVHYCVSKDETCKEDEAIEECYEPRGRHPHRTMDTTVTTSGAIPLTRQPQGGVGEDGTLQVLGTRIKSRP